jgi:hypothetical protein
MEDDFPTLDQLALPDFYSKTKAGKSRSFLTKEQAIEIHSYKFGIKSGRGACATIAKQYGVTPKTVRDIWSGRTWFRATCPTGETVLNPDRYQKRPGRPKGSKDRKPRQKAISMNRQELSFEGRENTRTLLEHALPVVWGDSPKSPNENRSEEIETLYTAEICEPVTYALGST